MKRKSVTKNLSFKDKMKANRNGEERKVLNMHFGSPNIATKVPRRF